MKKLAQIIVSMYLVICNACTHRHTLAHSVHHDSARPRPRRLRHEIVFRYQRATGLPLNRRQPSRREYQNTVTSLGCSAGTLKTLLLDAMLSSAALRSPTRPGQPSQALRLLTLRPPCLRGARDVTAEDVTSPPGVPPGPQAQEPSY